MLIKKIDITFLKLSDSFIFYKIPIHLDAF